MENITSELKISELKQRSLCKAYEELHSQASSILVFSLQWKDLESHFGSTRKLIETELELLMDREKDVIFREKELEAKGSELNSKLELKETQLDKIEKLIEQRLRVLESNNQHIDSLQFLIQENHKELEVKEGQYATILKWTGEKERELDRIESCVKEGEEKLGALEKRVKQKSEEAESKGSELNTKIELKETQLDGIEKLIEERLGVLESNTQYLNSMESLIQENHKELEVKQGQYAAILKSIGEKEREFDCIESRVKEGEEKLEILEKRVKQKFEEAEFKGKELESIRKRLKGYNDDIQLKNRKFNAIQRSIEEGKKEMELREEKLRVCDKVIKEKQEKLDSIRNSIVECLNELESKEKRYDSVRKEVKLKEKNLVWMKKITDQCVEKFVIKEREIEGFLEKLELREKFCESKFEELGSFEKKVNDSLKEVDSREKNLSSLQKLVDERSRELEREKNEFEKRVNEFNLSQKSAELGAKEKNNIIHSRVEIEQSKNTPINNAFGPLTAINQYSIPKEGQGLQLLLNQHLKRHDLLCVEISSVLRASLDPAKLVLDAMQGFYPSNLNREGSETFDVNIVRRSCILLLEHLMEASPQINSQVREEALKLAVDWKAKMTVADKNYYEVLGFLQFLASYRLASAFDPNELRSLFDIFGQHRQASELRQFLCPPVNAPVKIEQAENSLDNVATSSSNVQFSISTLQNNVLPLLQMSPDPAKFFLDSIQGSISEHWKQGDAGFEASVMMNYISVFEQLFRSLPQIQPLVKEDAMKLAVEWKSKMRPNTDYSLEILCFLQFLATYGLVSSFSEDEILKFLEKISQHKQAVDLCCTLGFGEKIPEFVQNLIQRKEIIDAVRFIFAFKLTDKFSPVPLLTEYMEDLKNSTQISCRGKKPIEEKEKATDKEIAALRAVIQSINVYNLESEFPSANISNRITLLEQIKDRRCSAGLVRSKFDQQQKQRSIHRKAVQQHQKPSDEQQHQKTLVCPNAEQQQEKPSVPSNAEQQQEKPLVQPKAEYQHRQPWKKLRNDKIAYHHSPPQDPAKFVLDSIRGSISEHWKRGDAGFEASVMMNYISMFEELFRSLPQIQPLVKEDAMKLAVEWRAKMRPNTDYSLEILCFLQFLETYGLVSSFSEDEILMFLEKISQHKQVVDLCCTLGFGEKIPELIQNLIRRKDVIDAVRFIFAFKLTDKFSPVPLLTEYMEDLKSSTQLFCKRKGKKHIEEKERATDEEIAALRAVIQSIEDYNLESEFPSVMVSKRIRLLEQSKKDRRRLVGFVRSKVDEQKKQQFVHCNAVQQKQKPSVCPYAEQQQEKPSVCPNAKQQHQTPSVHPQAEHQYQQSWKKRTNNSVAYHHSPPQGNHKFPRTSASSIRPHGPPVFIPIVPQPLEFPPRLHGAAMGFVGDPRQSGYGHIVSPNVGAGPNVGMPPNLGAGLNAEMPPNVGAGPSAGMPPNVGADPSAGPNAGMPPNEGTGPNTGTPYLT